MSIPQQLSVQDSSWINLVVWWVGSSHWNQIVFPEMKVAVATKTNLESQKSDNLVMHVLVKSYLLFETRFSTISATDGYLWSFQGY